LAALFLADIGRNAQGFVPSEYYFLLSEWNSRIRLAHTLYRLLQGPRSQPKTLGGSGDLRLFGPLELIVGNFQTDSRSDGNWTNDSDVSSRKFVQKLTSGNLRQL
jgi:hypothetical protein